MLYNPGFEFPTLTLHRDKSPHAGQVTAGCLSDVIPGTCIRYTVSIGGTVTLHGLNLLVEVDTIDSNKVDISVLSGRHRPKHKPRQLC